MRTGSPAKSTARVFSSASYKFDKNSKQQTYHKILKVGKEHMNNECLDTLCSALCYCIGIDAPKQAAPANSTLVEFADKVLQGDKCDHIFMYNPDAIGHWVSDKYPEFMKEVLDNTSLKLPLRAVMPSVTPVCFGTMYTGALPEVHGIRKYEKPVITIDTFFDALIRAGKKCAIVCTDGDSMSRIYNDRAMDYYYYKTLDEVNARAAALIVEDQYDVICVYNGDYDATMHRYGPEHALSLGALHANSHAFGLFASLIKMYWTEHRTLLGFAMDHGCHEIDAGCGSHGLDMDEDMDILHYYEIITES